MSAMGRSWQAGLGGKWTLAIRELTADAAATNLLCWEERTHADEAIASVGSSGARTELVRHRAGLRNRHCWCVPGHPGSELEWGPSGSYPRATLLRADH